MLDYGKLELQKLIYEVRYKKGWSYLDNSGVVMNLLIDMYPEFESVSVGNINDGVKFDLPPYNRTIS